MMKACLLFMMIILMKVDLERSSLYLMMNPLFRKIVSIDYDNKVPIYDDYGDDMYAIKNNDNHVTCHHDFNFQSYGSYFVELAPTTIHKNKFAYVESNKILMLMNHEMNA